jgi:hypothetical protein
VCFLFKMLIQKIFKSAKSLSLFYERKAFLNITSTPASQIFQIDKLPDRDYIVFKLNKEPVNSLNLESLILINEELDSIEKDAKVKGVILTSVSFINIF